MKVIHQSGSRKSAKARATLRPGSGIVRINSQLLSSLPDGLFKSKLQEPLLLAGNTAKTVNITITTLGGGIQGQAESARLAIAKALAQHDKKLRETFLEYDRNLLVADVRRKETHKPNCHGKARAKRQKSYR